MSGHAEPTNKFDRRGRRPYRPLRKLGHAWAGLRFGVLEDVSVAYKLAVSAVVLGASFLLRDWLDFGAVLVVTAMVLSAELFNTAIEALCDHVTPERHDRVRVIKDLAAAAAGVAILAWAVVIAYEYLRLARKFGG